MNKPKYKNLIVELSVIIGIYVINFVIIDSLLKPQNIFKPGFDVNMHDNFFVFKGQGVFLPTFLLATSLVFFIKEAIYCFKRCLQNYITICCMFLCLFTLFMFGYLVSMMVILFNNLTNINSQLLALPNLQTKVNPHLAILAKLPMLLILTELVLIIMLTITAIGTGKGLRTNGKS
jgi:hypothetical protein